jgi:hypothetical protein
MLHFEATQTTNTGDNMTTAINWTCGNGFNWSMKFVDKDAQHECWVGYKNDSFPAMMYFSKTATGFKQASRRSWTPTEKHIAVFESL